MRNSRGFTVIELVIAITMVGIISMVAIPRVKEGMVRESVRNARRAVTMQLARARAVATSRGCRAALHIATGAQDRVWVTSCPIAGTGTDTVGSVEDLTHRFGVDVAASGDSITFSPNGIAMGTAWTVLKFARSSYLDTLEISPIGRALW